MNGSLKKLYDFVANELERYLNSEKRKLVFIFENIWDKYARGEVEEQPVYIPDGFSRETMDAIQKHIYWKYYYRPAYLSRRLWKDITTPSRLKQDLRLGIGLLFSPRTRTGRP